MASSILGICLYLGWLLITQGLCFLPTYSLDCDSSSSEVEPSHRQVTGVLMPRSGAKLNETDLTDDPPKPCTSGLNAPKPYTVYPLMYHYVPSI